MCNKHHCYFYPTMIYKMLPKNNFRYKLRLNSNTQILSTDKFEAYIIILIVYIKNAKVSVCYHFTTKLFSVS